jgi:predicted membrane-bound spermidine synthase
VARVLAWNALGNLCGSLAAAFVLVPVLGSLRGLAVPLLTLAAAAWFLPERARERSRRTAVIASAAAALLALVLPSRIVEPVGRRAILLGVAEDEFGAYSLSQARRGEIRLFRYGQPVSGTFGEQRDNTRLAFDVIERMGKARDRIVMAGLGGACHLREAEERKRRDPGAFERIQIVEISPAVRRLARTFYGLPEDAFEHVVLGDFRKRLRSETADVYYIDLLSPAVEGCGYSFTREFHEEVRRALAPHGMLVQWFGRFGAVDFLPEITRTLDGVYGGGFVIRSEAGHFLYVVTKDPSDGAELERQLRSVRKLHAAGAGVPFEFWSTKAVLESVGGGAPGIVTEDRIPFGRLLLGLSRTPFFERERRLRALTPAVER